MVVYRGVDDMIIAAFAGTGKTYFCHNTANAIDFVCMPWKYRNFYEVSASLEEGEQIKANDDLELQSGWQEDYYNALIDTAKNYPDQIVVIPTISAVLRKMEENNIPYTLVIPDRDLKEEYEKRYRERGNTEEFLNVFIGNWDAWMDVIRQNKGKQVIELQGGQFLSDVIQYEKFKEDATIVDKETYIFRTYFSDK